MSRGGRGEGRGGRGGGGRGGRRLDSGAARGHVRYQQTLQREGVPAAAAPVRVHALQLLVALERLLPAVLVAAALAGVRRPLGVLQVVALLLEHLSAQVALVLHGALLLHMAEQSALELAVLAAALAHPARPLRLQQALRQ